MSANEFAFLALGLMLGVASGAALMEIRRSRPAGPREVKVTVARDSVPIRPTTLASDPFAATVGPAPYGPGDRRLVDRQAGSPVDAADDLAVPTPVSSPTRATLPTIAGGGFARSPAAPEAPPGRTMIGVAVQPETDGLYEALRAAEVRAATVLAAAGDRPGEDPVAMEPAPNEQREASTMTATRTAAVADDPPAASAAEPPTGPAEPVAQPRSGPCAELHTIAEDRCAVAARARAGATDARDRLREAQRAYDDNLTRAEEAERIADPRAVRLAKEAAQMAFRTARDAASDRGALESAAAAWLQEVNLINAAARDAAARAAREHASANTLVAVIERLTVEADAARISAESAEEACLAARQSAADCEERALLPPPVAAPAPPPEFGSRYPEEAPGLRDENVLEAPSDREARILRLLRGDGDALRRTVAELAGDDPDERRRWQLQLTGLVDAVTAQAMEAGAIDVPIDNPFWHPFSRQQSRDIVSALSSLGYRYDGLGGFADGRVPSQRDLSLAVGYAGLDPMRIRIWPTEHEMHGLFADARVAADEYLVDAAAGLTLGEMVALLGTRADALTDLWNEWGRVRPRLLAAD